jgi:hypothetical protein
MAEANVHRSQAILRMPVDYVDATLIHHDGERSEVIFLLPSGEDVVRVMAEGDAFIPVMRNAKICIIARASIAAVGVADRAPNAYEEDMPREKQRAAVKLTCGMMLDGEMHWAAVFGQQRLSDHLNSESRFVELRASDKTYFVFKAHVAYVQEL